MNRRSFLASIGLAASKPSPSSVAPAKLFVSRVERITAAQIKSGTIQSGMIRAVNIGVFDHHGKPMGKLPVFL